MQSNSQREFRFFLVAGEHSGDALGAKLMKAISRRLKGRVRYFGVGGELMEKQGLVSQFALAEVAVMGPLSILARLPRLMQRISSTAKARCGRHYRQSRVHPSRRQENQAQAARHPDRQLRVPTGVGVAAGPSRTHGLVY
jgi:hypothetical protein